MSEWRDDDRLNDTDREILEHLEKGRQTTGSLSRDMGKHPQTVRDRLSFLRKIGHVQYYHEPTGLHEPADGEDDG